MSLYFYVLHFAYFDLTEFKQSYVKGFRLIGSEYLPISLKIGPDSIDLF